MEALTGLGYLILRILETCLGYISGNQFPHPLGEDEERECILGVRRGDMECRNKLVEHNLRLVAHIVKKFDPTPQDIEDLISIGSIGLVKAVNTFRPDRGTRLATYASKCIENEILMHLRSIKNSKNEAHLDERLSRQGDDSLDAHIDRIPDDDDKVIDTVVTKIEAESLRAVLHVLDDKEREVIVLRYGLGRPAGKTQREIARHLGISRSYVSRIEKRALGKLQDAHPG